MHPIVGYTPSIMGYDEDECLPCYLGVGGNNPLGDEDGTKKSICLKCMDIIFGADLQRGRVEDALSNSFICTQRFYCFMCDEQKTSGFRVTCCDAHYQQNQDD